MKRFFVVSLFCLATLALSDSHRKIIGQSEAQNDAFHSSLLQQLADSRTSNSSDNVATPFSQMDHLELAGPGSFVTFATNSSTGLQIYTTDSLPANPAPPSACATALTAVIPCNDTIPLMAISPYLFTKDLAVVCTSTCSAGLQSYRSSVVSACGNYMVKDSANNSYSPTLAGDFVSGPYMVQCLKDPTSGDFCGPILQSLNTTEGILSLPKNQLCSFCVLETLNVTLSNPTSYSLPLANLLSQAITTCGENFTSYNITSNPGDQVVMSTPFGVNASTTSTVDCALTGRNTTATSATNCTTIASQFSVSEYDVFSSNPFLNADCNIPSGTNLCIPQSCVTYTIAVNDTCQSVAQLAGTVPGTTANITSAQIQSFNPDLGTYCQLMALRVGKAICLSPNGGWPNVGATTQGNPSSTPTTVAPIPSPTVSGTTSACGRYYQVQPGDICQTVAIKNGITFSDFTILNPEIDANCTNLWLNYWYCVAAFPPLSTVTSAPIVTTNYTTATVFSYPIPTANYTITYTTSTFTAAGVAAPTNIANGTRAVACGNYYTIVSGDTLDSVSTLVGVNASDLVTWNSEMSTGTLPPVGSAICILFPTGNYTLPTATRPSNAYANATQACAEYYTVISGDGCPSIETKFGITNTQFDALNPGLSATCTNLILGAAYCVLPTVPFSNTNSSGPPDNVASGTITNGCTQYYTVVSGDSCTSIDSKFNITTGNFLTWNPEINTGCTNIQVGLAYCVQSNVTSTGPPSNVANGTITSGCTQYYTVVSGDSCTLIDSKFNITTANFLVWNPEINTGCTNIQVGLAYCVQSEVTSTGPPSNVASGTITNGCTQYYTVMSGDSCTLIDSKFNITTANFLTWNPEINTGCTNIQVGLAYCVKSNISSTGPPSNLATGSLQNCTSYYTIVSGDSCSAIEISHNIAQSDFFRWNSEVATSCNNILVGEAYCVGGGGNACRKIYVVKSGDFCSAITQSQGITQATLNSLNLFLDANCDLSIGESLCVG